MRVQEIAASYPQALARAYIENFPGVSRFFAYNPHRQQDFMVRCHDLTGGDKQNRLQLAMALKEFNQSLGCGAATRQNIDLLANGALAVVTGQQPGILTGPLYTIYKAMGAIKLAGQLTQRLNRPVVPVFWIGADDHDFAEVNHIYVPTSQGPQRISLPDRPAGRFSLGHLPVPPEITLLLEQLEQLTPPVGWQQPGLQLLRETSRTSEDLARWFGRLMTYLLGDYGLVLVNPLLPPLRRLSAGVFHRAITTAPEVNNLLTMACARVTDLGFKPQVQSEPDKVHLFIYWQGQRVALYFRNGQFCNREATITWEAGELAELSLARPELFSPDVILRPVVQEVLLPVLAYVGGPGEIGYFALLGEIFKHFGQTMPIIFPRPNLTLVEPLVAKLMAKYQVPAAEIPGGVAEFITRYLQQADQVGFKTKFNDFRKTLAEHQRRLVKEIAGIDPRLKGIGQDNLRRLMRLVNSLEEKVNKRHRKNNEVAVRQLTKVNHMVHPLDQWQERVYNIFPYLMKYGPEILKDIYQAINPAHHGQVILFLD